MNLVSYVNRDVSRTIVYRYCHLVGNHSAIVPTANTRSIDKFHANTTNTPTYAADYMEHGPGSISSQTQVLAINTSVSPTSIHEGTTTRPIVNAIHKPNGNIHASATPVNTARALTSMLTGR